MPARSQAALNSGHPHGQVRRDVHAFRYGFFSRGAQIRDRYRIYDEWLHAFLTQFLDRVNELGAHICHEFLVPAMG